MIASSCGHVDIVDALIKAGADVNKQLSENKWKLTSINFALSGGKSPSIVKTLLENNASPNVIVENKTALDYAYESKQETISKLLTKYGGQTASQLQEIKEYETSKLKSSLLTCTTPATSLLTPVELSSEVATTANVTSLLTPTDSNDVITSQPEQKRTGLLNFMSKLFDSFTSHILNPTHTFKDTSVKQDNKKEVKELYSSNKMLLNIIHTFSQ